MKEVVQNTPEALPVAQQVGRKVLVSVQVRLSEEGPWYQSSYEPWVGVILTLSQSKSVNGYVNVMPEEPRGGDYPSRHPRIIDLSARAIENTSAEMRHVLHDYTAGTPGMLLDNEPRASDPGNL
jgi:hypothetical protein